MAVIVAVLALLFTVGSFWWLNARPGRIIGSAPAAFAMVLTPRQSRFRIPLVMYNTGARTLVVESLRLVVSGSQDQPLEWITVRDRLRPQSDELMDFSAPFAIDGRRALRLFVEFGEDPPVWAPPAGSTHEVSIEGRLLGRSAWKSIVRFPLAIPDRDLGAYITRHNPPVERMHN